MLADEGSQVLRPGEVGEVFGVDAKTVARWAKDGKIKGFITPGNHWRFYRRDVDEAIDRGVARGGGGTNLRSVVDYARWVVSLDDGPGTVGGRERQHVTLNQIIEKARAALTAAHVSDEEM